MIIDTMTRDISVNGRLISMTTMEFDILLELALNSGNVVTREALYKKNGSSAESVGKNS